MQSIKDKGTGPRALQSYLFNIHLQHTNYTTKAKGQRHESLNKFRPLNFTYFQLQTSRSFEPHFPEISMPLYLLQDRRIMAVFEKRPYPRNPPQN